MNKDNFLTISFPSPFHFPPHKFIASIPYLSPGIADVLDRFFFFFFLCPRSAHFTKHPSDSLCNRCGRFRLQYLFGFFFQFGSRYLLVNELVRDSVLWRAHTHTHTIKMSNLFKWLVFRAMIINLEHFVVSKWTAHFSRKRVDNETTLRTKQQKNCGNHRNGNFIGFF